MISTEDPVSAHLSRVASLLAENVHSTAQLAELRNAISTAISNYTTAQVKHVYLDSMLEVAANVWNTSLALEEADLATHATLKQASLDLQWALENPTKLPLTHQLRLAEHAFKVAEIWGVLEEWEAVDAALGRGLTLTSALSAAVSPKAAGAPEKAGEPTTPHSTQERCALVHFNSLLLRLRASVRLGQELPANALLLKLKLLTSNASYPLRQRTMFSLDLLATLVFEGEHLLEVNTNSKLAVQILQAAYDAYTSLSSTTPELQAVGLADDAEKLGARALILLCWAQITASDFNKTLNLVDSSGAGGGGGGIGMSCVSSESILKCVHALQKHSSRTADSVAVHFLAHQALQHAGRMQEAETELLKLVTHESVSAETCAFAIKSALLVAGGAESARAALAAAQDLTTTDDVSLIVELIEAVLGPSSQPPHGTTTTFTIAPPTTADEVILDLLEDEALKEALDKNPEILRNLYTLCWNKACSLLEAGAPEVATKFYSAALLFVTPETDLEIVTQIHMAVAVCFSALGQHAKALERLKKCPERCVEAQFCKLTTCLAAKDADAASAALNSLAAHPACDANMLRLICCEALDAGLPNAAKESLFLLLQKIVCSEEEEAKVKDDNKEEDASVENRDVNTNSSKKRPANYEALVFQNLIQLEMDTLDQASEPAPQIESEETCKISPTEKNVANIMKDGSENVGHAGPWNRLARVFEILVRRINAVGGVENFFLHDDCKWRQLEWMVVTAWNAGLDAASRSEHTNNQDASGRLMKCCGQLCAGHPSPTDEILRKQQVSFTLAANAIIHSAASGSEAAPAVECLEKARCAAQQRDGDASNSDDAVVYIHVMVFALAVKQRDAEAANAAVERVKEIHSATPKSFLQMALYLEGEDTTHTCAAARKAAMKAALERLTSQPELNYEAVAGVIRSLLAICSTDTDRLSTLQDAAALITANAQPATAAGAAGYPPLEARYLITAAWNRGATHSKFARMKEAEAFMGVALRILGAFSSNENPPQQQQQEKSGGIGFSVEEKKMMNEEYARVLAAAESDAVGAGGAGGGIESMNLD
ncbi:hypothetical protein Ndes2526A_g06559 [Nannochloris sp. 'desiccata']